MSISDEEIQQMLISKRKSILSFYKEDILKMKNSGVTLLAIKKWLEEKYQISTSTENIRQFCLRYNKTQSINQEEKKNNENIFNSFKNLNEE